MHLLLFFPATIALLGLLHVANCEQAMTTVLARPLGGYGLTPLIFEPSPSLASSSYSSLGALLGLGSSQLETKVRKSPVYELIMPNYDDEALSTGFTMEAPLPPPAQPLPLKSSARKAPSKGSASSAKKSVDYESLISKQSAADRAALVSALPSTNSYYSTANGMLGSNVLFGSSQHSVGKSSHSSHSSYYNEPMPSYKESISRSDNFGGGGGGSKGGGYSGGQSSYGDGGGSLGGGLNAAIQSVRSVEVKDVQNMYENAEPQVIDIPPSGLPIVINFRTSSSQIQIHQTHENAEPVVVEPTKSEDEPTYLKHQVTKPVIQEVHEIIMPYRKILQEIQPVQEEVKTIVARGKPRDQGKRGGGGGKYNSNANAGYGGGHKSRGGGLGGLGGDINMSTGKSYKS